MHVAVNHRRDCGIRQEQKSIQNTLHIKEIKRRPQQLQKPDSGLSLASALERPCQYSPKDSKPKRRRAKQKPYITTKAEIQKHKCSDIDHNNESMSCHEPKTILAMKEERECRSRSLSTSSSTPRVSTCIEPREFPHLDATDDSARTNEQPNERGKSCISHQTSELKLEDSPLPCSTNSISGTDASKPIRYSREVITHQEPCVNVGIYNISPSVPTSPNTRQIQSHEHSRRYSDPNHVYQKVPSLKLDVPTVAGQPVDESTLCNTLGLSSPLGPDKAPSRHTVMENLPTATDVSNAHEYDEPSHRHVPDTSSAFELSILYGQWQRISQMRSGVISFRYKLGTMRRKLRALGEEKSLADDAYFKQVKMRELHMPFPQSWWPQKTLEELLGDCQKVRDEYSSLEDEYNHFENDLDSQEYGLSRQEEYFYSQLLDPSRFFPASIEAGNVAVLQEPEKYETQVFHPLVEEYLTNLGHLDNFRELYDDILEEKLDLEDRLASRKRFDMSLMPEDQEWLDGSQSQLDDLVSKIKAAEIKEKELREPCLSMGLIDENGDPIEPPKRPQIGPSLSTAPKTLENPREYVQPPLTLPPDPNNWESIIEILDSDDNKLARNERFDCWALEKLQFSLHETTIYANCFDNYDDLTDISKLKKEVCQEDFIDSWFADGFTNDAPKTTCFTATHSTSQHIPHTNSSCSKVCPSDLLFSKSSSHSVPEHLDSAEGEP